MSEFKLLLFGEELSIAFYMVAMILMLFGFLIFMRLVYVRRPNKHIKFDIRYWLVDNLFNMITGFIGSFLLIRFTDDILSTIDNLIVFDLSFIMEYNSSMFIYVVIGFLSSSLPQLIKKIPFVGSLLKKKTDPTGKIRYDEPKED